MRKARVVGQTIFQHVFAIDCQLLIGCYKSQDTQSTLVTCILLRVNGSPLLLPSSIAKIIINDLNNISNNETGPPYWYHGPRGNILFNFKVVGIGQYLQKYLQHKVKKINETLPQILYFYGIIGKKPRNWHKNNRPQKQIHALALSLNSKKQILQIIKQHISKKSLKKFQSKSKQKSAFPEQSQFISHENLSTNSMEDCGSGNGNRNGHGYANGMKLEKIYKYFSGIQGRDAGEAIEKSSKFQMVKGRFRMVVDKDGEEGEVDGGRRQQYLEQNIQLVKKAVKYDLDPKVAIKATRKLNRQITLLKNIKHGKEYFLSYYLPKQTSNPNSNPSSNQPPSLYMQYLPSNLAFALTNSIFGLKDLLIKFKQIVEGIQMLHKSGIVHRDLKPENVMVVDQMDGDGPSIKIIDFSDSALMSEKYTTELSNNLGSSLPYSPFECVYNCQFGVNDPLIDSWSLGIILHELIYTQPPCLNHHHTNTEQFMQGISNNQLTIDFPKLGHRKKYFDYLEQFSHHLMRHCLLLIHYQRIGVEDIGRIVGVVLRYVGGIGGIVGELGE